MKQMNSANRSWLTTRWHELVLAGSLLTRFPMPRLPADLLARPGDSVWAFPLVGAVVGACGGVVFWCSSVIGLPAGCGAVAALATTCLVTGCFHEDGLADMVDGIGGGRTREAKLEIMRDSRVGTYGAVALILSLAGRWVALGALLPIAGFIALIVAHTMGRGLLGIIFLTLSPARSEGLGASTGKPSGTAILLALAGPFAMALLLLSPVDALVVTIAAGTAVFLVSWLAYRYLGGHTGDVFGAAEQGGEIAALWALVGLLSA